MISCWIFVSFFQRSLYYCVDCASNAIVLGHMPCYGHTSTRRFFWYLFLLFMLCLFRASYMVFFGAMWSTLLFLFNHNVMMCHRYGKHTHTHTHSRIVQMIFDVVVDVWFKHLLTFSAATKIHPLQIAVHRETIKFHASAIGIPNMKCTETDFPCIPQAHCGEHF